MDQLALRIIPRLAYSPENFMLHAGVQRTFVESAAALKLQKFLVCFLEGAPRSGKTHFSIRLSDELLQAGLMPRLVEGQDFAAWLEEQSAVAPHSDEVVIIDDCHLYFSSIAPGQSGKFVDFAERLKNAQARLYLISAEPIENFQCDEHIKSRILPGASYSIGAPTEDDMPSIIAAMARQRGLSLTERNVAFLSKRLGRSFAAVEEFFQRATHLSQVLGRPITMPLLADALERSQP